MTRRTRTKKTGLDPIKLFRLFPVANKWFLACIIAFAVVNGTLDALSFMPIAFSTWLKFSNPITNTVSHILPAIDWETRFLMQINFPKLVPAIRNALALNFIVALIFPIPIVAAAYLDLTKRGSTVCCSVDELVARTGRSIYFFIVGSFLGWTVICPLVYVGILARPWVLSLTMDYVLYPTLFWGCVILICMPVVLLQVRAFEVWGRR